MTNPILPHSDEIEAYSIAIGLLRAFPAGSFDDWPASRRVVLEHALRLAELTQANWKRAAQLEQEYAELFDRFGKLNAAVMAIGTSKN